MKVFAFCVLFLKLSHIKMKNLYPNINSYL